MKRVIRIMNKNKLTITIICLVLIGFIAAESINQRNMKTRTEYITITRTEKSTTDVPVMQSTEISVTKIQKSTAVRTTTANKSVIVTETASAHDEPLWINLNTADHDELIKLPNIGDVLADSIISYREKNGEFRNIEEIMLVNGIGEGIFSEICYSIYVENPVYDKETLTYPEENTETVYEPEEEPTESMTEEITEYAGPLLEDVVPIDLNTADAELLMLLPYISEEAAIKIVELRETIGRFSHPYELYYANVLEPYQIEEICEYVIVESSENDESKKSVKN